MAQTKRKRRTKHRGNAAGTVEVRGRTGRPPSPDERKKQSREQARQARLSKPPTWRQSLNRALLAGAFIFLFMTFTTKKHQVVAALIFAILAIGIYVPSGFYLESYLYKRRMRRQGASR